MNLYKKSQLLLLKELDILEIIRSRLYNEAALKGLMTRNQ